jgi:phospholipid/cholesterol/gamma-HCH transport system substrate-binding protein
VAIIKGGAPAAAMLFCRQTSSSGARPGCRQKITRDLWPAPYLVMDTGASIAPYNHLEIAQPMLIDYVWGRQVGELSINP